MKKVIILGATGSVGSSTLSVIREHPSEFEVVGLAARRASDALGGLAAEFPRAAVAAAEDADGAFGRRLATPHREGKYYSGPDGAVAMLRDIPADICVAAMGGTAGLRPAFAAAEIGMRILLANKEVLVSAGRLFMDATRAGGAKVLPLDSEHAALWQCLEGRDRAEVHRVVLTASGGPFRTWTSDKIASATPADALKHPVWKMGAKISIDSATLANKALEVIEAHALFSLPAESIEVIVHPQSVVHAMIEFVDGAVLAHMGIADMRQPISYMLFYPHRKWATLPRLDLAKTGRLDFEEPDLHRFPMLEMGLEACRRGGAYPALYNAANEAAVELFLEGGLTFSGLALAVAKAMEREIRFEPESLDAVAEIHETARRSVMEYAG